ncbi:hypothetical protein M0802_004919 [Mischocyttarus mexicanus]|nr:hypothetical protein M0802_004919 [Mischocyttarus mexicanus]
MNSEKEDSVGFSPDGKKSTPGLGFISRVGWLGLLGFSRTGITAYPTGSAYILVLFLQPTARPIYQYVPGHPYHYHHPYQPSPPPPLPPLFPSQVHLTESNVAPQQVAGFSRIDNHSYSMITTTSVLLMFWY